MNTVSRRHGLDIPAEDRGWYRLATAGDDVFVVYIDEVWLRDMVISRSEAEKLSFKSFKN